VKDALHDGYDTVVNTVTGKTNEAKDKVEEVGDEAKKDLKDVKNKGEEASSIIGDKA